MMTITRRLTQISIVIIDMINKCSSTIICIKAFGNFQNVNIKEDSKEVMSIEYYF
jgi:hypothetical protein